MRVSGGKDQVPCNLCVIETELARGDDGMNANWLGSETLGYRDELFSSLCFFFPRQRKSSGHNLLHSAV